MNETATVAATLNVPNEQAFRLLVDSVQDYAIFLLDPQGRVQSWNAGARRIKGYEAHEIIGRSFEVFYPDEARRADAPREGLRHAHATGRFEAEGLRVRRDGSTFWASVVITALRGPTGDLIGYAKVTRDLTERRAHEEALRRSEEQLRLMIESVRDYAIVMLDPHGCVLSWNAAAQAITGHPAAEIVGRPHTILFAPQDVEAGLPLAELDTARRNGRYESHAWRVGKGGEALRTSVVLTTMFDRAGELRGFAAVIRDLTQQRRLQELEAATMHTNEFLAVLAHELRNPLAPMRNAVAIMQIHPDMPDTLGPVRDIVDRQLRQLTRLVDDLLDVARLSTGRIQLRREAVDFREIAAAALEAARPLAQQRGQCLDARLDDAPMPVLADGARLVQALQNLLNNAVKFTPERGRIELSAQVRGGDIVVAVTDTGRGIAPEAIERIFQMFVQEHPGERAPADAGLGIGLNLARALVEQHGGRLVAHSDGPGRGSTFTVVLPLRETGVP
jgi:PAS domain S-box-containing protein